ncbi:cysteine--tRNA ligase [Streptomyces sp. NPDC058401]|uniref:cysteine--tRNA ligase n=1 Tax=Streptomyces sp. NPDC058401 TaxID=3346480 RepID=UPI00364FF859
MALSLFDTGTRAVREFVPLHPGEASIYVCGATVQSPPHIGHIRSAVAFDVLARWLAHGGHTVTLCRNVTDIDDKILVKGAAEGVPYWQVAQRNERIFREAYDALGCLPPTVEPRATGHVPEMIVLIRELIARGHAYAAVGDVFFDVGSDPAYGGLSGQRPDALLSARPSAATATTPATAVASGKRDARDFALWKAAKPGEPFWETPWGPGRPGWHLECSAMAHRYLGETFDIHGGGIDLLFPHHENERAQSRAAGHAYARYWLHNAWVTLGGEKMSKSLGNSLLVSEILAHHRPVVLRYYLAVPHYRSTVEFTDAALQEAATAYERIESSVRRAAERLGAPATSPGARLPAQFAAALDDDLGVPQAIAVVHQHLREGNSALSDGNEERAAALFAGIRSMLDVLGLDPLAPQWAASPTAVPSDLLGTLSGLVELALDERRLARGHRDYAAADRIRDRLLAAGIDVEDTPDGPRWGLGSPARPTAMTAPAR